MQLSQPPDNSNTGTRENAP